MREQEYVHLVLLSGAGPFSFSSSQNVAGAMPGNEEKFLLNFNHYNAECQGSREALPVGFLQYSTLQRLEELEPCPIDPSNGSLPGKVQSYRLRWWCPLSCRLRDQEQLFEFHT